MTLKAIKPTKIEKRLKTLFYGCAGSGKTMASIQFPKPYLIDTERGAENDEYVEMLDKQGGAILQTSDFDEILAEIKELMTEKHEYRTLIIDPITIVYDNLLETSEEKLRSENPEKDPTAFGRHYGAANKRFKQFLRLITRLDMNVIMTAHAKTLYGENLVVSGQTFDAYKKMDYPFDLILEIKKFGKKRKAKVVKTRIKGFEEDIEFPFSYDYIAEKYGNSILEKVSENQKLATKEQVEFANQLITILQIPEDVIDKWLKKANATNLEDMETSKIEACINLMKNKIGYKEEKTDD